MTEKAPKPRQKKKNKNQQETTKIETKKGQDHKKIHSNETSTINE